MILVNELKLKITKDICLDTEFYTEGPVIDGDGNVYVTNLLGGKILKIDCLLTMDEWGACESPNGQYISAEGNHWVCNTLASNILVFDRDGKYKYCAYDGTKGSVKVVSPNDLWVEPDGSFYFTDSVRELGQVVFVDLAGEAHLLSGELDYPNGIVLDKVNNRLLVAESYQNRILSIDLTEKGAKPSVWLDLPVNSNRQEIGNLPDGLALDQQGNLWIAHYGMGRIYRVDISSKECYGFDVGFPLSSNICAQNGRLILTGGVSEPKGGKIRMIWYA